ncbi:D-glutamic acid-adding enzyme [Citrus sinensis]|uniref:D-glutamic acid-adding enzyme n=1 Tax=Citrus sinensis TaxID=2711 RepID=A0ACB8HVL4_CITSI|nr:D-glutamic acid-adding enzyme [Citrus sinensis]
MWDSLRVLHTPPLGDSASSLRPGKILSALGLNKARTDLFLGRPYTPKRVLPIKTPTQIAITQRSCEQPAQTTDKPTDDGPPPSRDRGSRTHVVVRPNSDEIDDDGGGWSRGSFELNCRRSCWFSATRMARKRRPTSKLQINTLIGRLAAGIVAAISVAAAGIDIQMLTDLQGQSVAVIGLGKSGRAAARLALARGASVLAIDQNQNLGHLEKDSLFEKYNDGLSLRTILGDFDGELLKDVDVVVVSPGVSVESYGLACLLQSGKRVMSELDFAAQVIPRSIKILAVTGTNGKSTVVTFVGQMLNHLGIEAFVGGNLGNPLSEAAFHCIALPSSKPKFQASIVEVSSYQMEIPNKYFCPTVSVVLNLTPDHLERHKTMKNYALTKCHLFSHMVNTKLGLLPFGNQHLNEAIKGHRFNLAWIGAFPGVKIDTEAKTASFEVPAVGVVSQLQLHNMKVMGRHNYHNAAVAALSVLGLDIGVDVEALNSTIEILRTPPHRMQIVHRDIQGVTWVDDSKATNLEATCTGLMDLKGHKSDAVYVNVNAICVSQLKDIYNLVYERVLIWKTLVNNGLSIPCFAVANMKDAVNHARRMATNGDAIVLSPGCASFDEFRNFEHRGMVFQELAFSA